MDNLDGKQARRTSSSSALGELFDHGCDSLFISCMAICLDSALQISPLEHYICLSAGITVFYASHWEEYHTNKLVLGRYANPTEAQVSMMVLLVIAGIFGPKFFSTPFSTVVGGLPSVMQHISLTQCIVMGATIGFFYCVYDNSIKVIKWAKENNKSIVEGFTPIIPVFIQIFLLSLWIYFSKNVITTSAIYFDLLNGILSSYMCDELVICRITKMKFTPLRPILVLPLLAVLNVAFTSSPIIPEAYTIPTLLFILVSIYVYFLFSVTQQLTHRLGIYIFWIPLVKPNASQ